MTGFRDRYGPWALVAGVSEGIGLEFVHALAKRGLDIVAVAQRPDVLAEAAARTVVEYGVSVRPLVFDLNETEVAERILELTGDVDIGLLIDNAAPADLGSLVDGFGRRLGKRGRGGMVVMSPLDAELSKELSAHGIDVVARTSSEEGVEDALLALDRALATETATGNR